MRLRLAAARVRRSEKEIQTMAWNEPGGGKRDPWQGKPQPPDMEAMLRRLRDGVNRLFGGGGAGGGHGLIPVVVAFLILAWIAVSSWQSIDARQIGVVLRFGQFNRVMSSGLNLKWPAPIERVISVDATTVKQVSDEVRMLTKDENIVLIDFNVQYSVTDAREYLFSMSQPDQTIKQAAESALRQVIGTSDMDTILSGQGTQLVQQTEKALRATLDAYHIGLQVHTVNFQKILPPAEVKAAFDDANNAGNNQQEVINNAIAYKAREVPIAEGDAARVRAEAEGYRAAQIAIATGEAARFSKIEEQYKLAPEVTRKRLYLETMQGALANSVKVLDASNGKNLIYLPLDKLKADAAVNAAAADAAKAGKEGGQ
jgi:membrane protease subunit HflK